MLAPGIRVVRGPDWSWHNQDGGEGHTGTVCEIGRQGSQHSPELTVVVNWDAGLRTNYRTGHQGHYDLRIIDNAQIGVKHPNIICDECKKAGLAGIRFRCARCPDYDLCVGCYGADKHDLDHPFVRYQAPNSLGVNVGPRRNAVKIQLKGIFVGAKVVRGPDWEWGNQDGGEGKIGRVMDIRGWDNESSRSVANVSWVSGSTNVYRLGHKGNMDLKYIQESSGGFYYRDHMPILGKFDPVQPAPPGGSPRPGVPSPAGGRFAVGDRVLVEMDVESLKQMQQGHGGWNPRMAQYIGKIGTVHRVTERGDIRVQHEGCANRWTFHPAALRRVDSLESVVPNGDGSSAGSSAPGAGGASPPVIPINVGDRVKVNSDAAKVRVLQRGHGEWVDDMQQALGKVGNVTKVYSDGDLRIQIGNKTWTLNPLCVSPLTAKLTTERCNSMADLSHQRTEPALTPLPVMTGSTGYDKLVREAAQGNMEFVKNFLEQHPDQVDARSGGKSCLQVAAHQGHLNLVKFLLDKRAEVNQVDNDKDSTLHYAAFGNQPEVMEILLKAGAHINVLNASQCSALHISAHKKPPHCVKVLLKYGADVNIQDSYGDTALHDAIGKESTEVIELLCNTPATDVTLRNKRGFNPLHHAALKGNAAAAVLLLRRARQLADVRKEDGFSALHLASLNGHAPVAEVLVNRGRADPDLRNNRRQTPLLLAVSQGHCGVIETLVSLQCALNCQDEDGDTALHLCIIKSVPGAPPPEIQEAPRIRALWENPKLAPFAENRLSMAIACFLVQEGCLIDVANGKSKTALDLLPNDEAKQLLLYFRAKRVERPQAPPIAPKQNSRDPMNISGPSGINIESLSLSEKSNSKNQTSVEMRKTTQLTECMVCNEPLKSGPVFEPCGHRIACDDCGARMKKCLKCVVDQKLEPPKTAGGETTQSPKSVSDRMRYLESKIQEIEEIHCCSICMERRRNVAFLCGHGACEKCAEPLKTCHMCREKIVTKINLF